MKNILIIGSIGHLDFGHTEIIQHCMQNEIKVIVHTNEEKKVNPAFEPAPIPILIKNEILDPKIQVEQRNKYFDKPKHNFNKK